MRLYTIMQMCRELDITYQTQKFYYNEGLVPNVKRDKNNRRIFDGKDVKWIKDLTCLNWKQGFYDEVLSGKRPYASNPIAVENINH